MKPVEFSNLQSTVTLELIKYIKRVGLGDKVRINDLNRIDASLFSAILKNSIAEEPIDRADFEAAFQGAIPKDEEITEWLVEVVSKMVQIDPAIPQCLTPIPLIDKEIGLVGREGIVGDIRKMLEESTCIVLVNGLGGIGKTAVMQGICNDLKDDGNYVAWINCGDSLRDDLLMLRDALHVPKEEKADKAFDQVKAGIQRLGKKLYLFMDDLSREVTKKERDVINELGVHVMITSRKENLPFRKKKLGYLADQDAIKMFYGYYGGVTECNESVWKIIESVNSHTLLVELLAKAAKEEGGTLDAFYRELEKEGFFDVSEEEIETEHDDENLTIEESVIRLYKISKLSGEQQRIMKLFTIFTPEKEIYYKVREWAGFDRKEMKKLVNLGWLERGGLENGYQIHQIVRDALKRQVGAVRLEDYGKFLFKICATKSYLSATETYEVVRERIVLARDIADQLWNKYQSNPMEGVMWASGTSVLMCNLASVYFEQGDYEKALKYYGKACNITEQMLGTENPNAATIFNDTALVYYNQGDYEKALEYYSKALIITMRVLGMEHPLTATVYNNVAMVYQSLGNYQKTLQYLEKALAIRERVLGTEDPATATTYHNMAVVYQSLGNYEKALEYCGTSLAIRERMLETKDPDIARSYNNMAMIYLDKGDNKEALAYFDKALAISEYVLGAEHPLTVTIYRNIALAYDNQGEHEKALDYIGKALAIEERVLGAEHPDTATTYNTMAGVYYKQGDFEKAVEYLGKALTIRERVFGVEHLNTAIIYNNMGRVYDAQKNYEKAQEFLEKALAIFERALGEDHPDTAATYYNMAVAYYAQGDYEKAVKYNGKALAIRECVLGMEHPDTAMTYHNMAGLYRALGDYEKALEYVKKANAAYLTVFGENHPLTQYTKISIQMMELLI
ncbi:MAG: tetratricopeptide repeat protein [Firmicutes bacterium]|nr:tetratricopeptide repeat protein [Bacillota bacterium]